MSSPMASVHNEHQLGKRNRYRYSLGGEGGEGLTPMTTACPEGHWG